MEVKWYWLLAIGIGGLILGLIINPSSAENELTEKQQEYTQLHLAYCKLYERHVLEVDLINADNRLLCLLGSNCYPEMKPINIGGFC